MFKLTVISLALLAASNEAMADIYKYVDETGHTFYTDEPRNKLYKRVIKTPPPRPQATISNPFKQTAYSPFKQHNLSAYAAANKERYNGLIADVAQRYQVDEKLVHAVIQTESAYNSTVVSRAGATGLMQLMPDTARRFGVFDRTDPNQNVDGGTRYLRYLIDMFGPRLDLAIAAYNAGENAVIRHNNSIPPYQETQDYVRQVLALYKK